MNKYHAQKTTVCGITFDSKAEANYYLVLKAREQKGEIMSLQRQTFFELLPSQRVLERDGRIHTWRNVGFIADFEFFDLVENRHRVVDVKGVRTPVYKIKKKLMMEKYGILIEEVG